MGKIRTRPASHPGHGSCLLACVICGRPIRRNPVDAHDRVICGPPCRIKLIRKQIDENPDNPQITCRNCGRIFRTRSEDFARCPDCHTWGRVP